MDKKKIALLSVGALVLGVSGYFAYRGIRKFISNLGNKDDKNTPKPQPQSQGNVGSTPTASTSSNPFKTKSELLAFQQWVINVKGDKTILGSGGASGFGDDGLWGRKSAKAWNQYGNEYKNTANTALVWHNQQLLALWEGGAPHHISIPDFAYSRTSSLTGNNRNCTGANHKGKSPA